MGSIGYTISGVPTIVLKTKTTRPFVLVKARYEKATYDRVARRLIPGAFIRAEIVGYAETDGPKVKARARRLGAHILPVTDYKVYVEV